METGIRVGTPLNAGVTPSSLQAWKAGQILKAVVISGTPPEAGGGRAVLRIGNQEYAVRSQTPLQTGDTLQLEVKRTQPEPVLQRLPNRLPATTVPNTTAQVSTRALEQTVKTLLAQQSSLAAGLQTLAAKLPQLSPATVQRLDALLAALPSPATLTHADGLRNSLATAGNQLEAMLQQNSPLMAAKDFKGQLMQTLAALSSADAHSVRTTLEGMTARISLNQLHSTSQAGTQGLQWLVEVPVRTAQGFQDIRFEIQTQQNSPHDTPKPAQDWSVKLQLNLPGLGPLEARVASAGGSVSAHFWAEQAPTAARIEAALPELAAAWRDKGLQPGALHAYQGHAPSPAAKLPDSANALVDTRA